MTLRALWCAYPWDLIDAPDAASRARDTGADGIALAAAYHGVRAATPLHPRHRLVDAQHSAIYVPYRAEIWRGHRIRPRPAGDWVSEGAFQSAATSARAAGLEVEPWVVLTHHDDRGGDGGSLRVHNAFGDVYGYALCPSHEAVREYCATLASESVLLSGAESVVVEACGPLGVEHLGAHEKTTGSDWSALDAALLSICFCNECERAMAAAGHDPDAVRNRVRGGVGSGAARIDQVLADATTAVLDVRRSARDLLAHVVSVAARAAGAKKVRFHAQPDPWATGPFAALWDTPGVADALILPADHLSARERLRAPQNGERLGAYLSVLPPENPEGFATLWASRLRGVDDLYLYHLGLASAQRVDAGAAVIDAVRVAGDPGR